ncbi:MAG TPA: hypothetical protein VM012_14915 [Flavitalea sp.]|nr:hypothetical protein [Flavitalea sp.]
MTHRYLLLRRNQQTGPYSVDELQKLPLQEFDLVWIEGISDSWKFPGEIEELKSFAPYLGNMQFNFEKRKPGVVSSHDSLNSSVNRTDNSSLEKTERLNDVNLSRGQQTQHKTSQKNNLGLNRKSAFWLVPLAVLLIVGIWIGTNWQYFPANEEIGVPMTNNSKKTPVEVNREQPTVADTKPEEKTPEIEKKVATDEIVDEAEVPGTELSTIDVREPEDGNEVSEPEKNEVPKKGSQNKAILKSTTPTPEKNEIAGGRITTDQKNAVRNKNNSDRNKFESARIASNKRTAAPYSDNSQVVQSSGKINSSKENAKGATVALNTGQKNTTSQNEPVSYFSSKQVPVDNLVDVDGNFQITGKVNGIGNADITLYNRSGKTLKAVKVEVQYLGENNTVLAKKIVTFTNISTDGAVKYDLASHSSARKIGYKVLYISSAIGDFYYEPVELFSSASR